MAHRNRLSTSQFAAVFDRGSRHNHKWFTLRVLPVESDGERGSTGRVLWGFAVGKRLASSSVERNRLRRRLRAAVAGLESPCDAWVVVQLRARGREASQSELRSAIGRALQAMGGPDAS